MGAFYADPDPDGVVALAQGLVTAPHVVDLTSLGDDGDSFALPGAYGEVQPEVFGPNVRFVSAQPVPVSEPESLAQVALALVGAAGVLRRQGAQR